MSVLNNKNVLITGAAGFVGSNLARAIKKQNPKCNLFLMDNFSSGSWENLSDIEGDILTIDLAKSPLVVGGQPQFRPDIIFHQAALTDPTVTDVQGMMLQNVEATRNVAYLSAVCQCKFICASSAAIYGNNPCPFVVGKNERPHNPYGFSKLAMERMLNACGINAVCLRYVNVYGPGEGHKGRTSSMIGQMINAKINNRKVTLFEDGTQARDWIHIDDVVEANLRAIDAKSGSYNIGTGQKTSFLDLVDIIGVDYEFVDQPRDYQCYTQVSLEHNQGLDWKPQISIKDGIEYYIKELECQEKRK